MCYGIIPARFGSTRFPGKPLVEICGKPMFWHVYQRAKQCSSLISVSLATDDQRIFDAAVKLDVPVVLTGDWHQSGTDRVYEAAVNLKLPENAVVVNIQGDEPALNPSLLDALVEAFNDQAVQVSTLARPLTKEESTSPDRVKVVLANNGDALYFSRSLIPYLRDECDNVENIFLMHLGFYAFRLKTLKQFTQLAPGRLENLEKLEQLRFLENNIPIRVKKVNCQSFGVDSPEDLEKVIKIMQNI
ncbi:3-deoxy-manno-octulosonate cytidylyltransferase [Desulfovibrio litoralis]|nr:3-deoxy-manno-octulosonate cytidylyltransferase [Desulfovibrio litoralis]